MITLDTGEILEFNKLTTRNGNSEKEEEEGKKENIIRPSDRVSP